MGKWDLLIKSISNRQLNNQKFLLVGEPGIRASGKVVIRPSREIPKLQDLFRQTLYICTFSSVSIQERYSVCGPNPASQNSNFQISR